MSASTSANWREAEDTVHGASLMASRRLGQVGAETGSVRLLFLAIVAGAMVATSCGTPQPAAGPTPHSTAGLQTWPQDLTLAGEVNAHANTTLPDAGAVTSSCTGKYSGSAGYSLTLALSTDQGVFQLLVNAAPYRGPGTYTSGPGASRTVTAGIVNAERTNSWTSGPEDPVTFTVEASQDSGTVDATFSEHNRQASSKSEIARGRWTCRS